MAFVTIDAYRFVCDQAIYSPGPKKNYVPKYTQTVVVRHACAVALLHLYETENFCRSVEGMGCISVYWLVVFLGHGYTLQTERNRSKCFFFMEYYSWFNFNSH